MHGTRRREVASRGPDGTGRQHARRRIGKGSDCRSLDLSNEGHAERLDLPVLPGSLVARSNELFPDVLEDVEATAKVDAATRGWRRSSGRGSSRRTATSRVMPATAAASFFTLTTRSLYCSEASLGCRCFRSVTRFILTSSAGSLDPCERLDQFHQVAGLMELADVGINDRNLGGALEGTAAGERLEGDAALVLLVFAMSLEQCLTLGGDLPSGRGSAGRLEPVSFSFCGRLSVAFQRHRAGGSTPDIRPLPAS